MTRNNQKLVYKGGWDQLQNALLTDNQTSISGSSESFFIKPAGTKLFVLNGTIVETYPLTIPYDVATLGSIEDSFTITEDTTPTGISFKNDGAKMFIVGQTTKTIYEYILPTNWTPSSIIATPVSLSLSTITDDVIQCVFSIDGDFLFVNDDTSVYRFPLPTPWDITSNVSNNSFTPTGEMGSFVFKPQGDKLYIGDIADVRIIEYDLPTPWDITTAIATGNILDLDNDFRPDNLLWRSNGLEFFILNNIVNTVTKLHLDIDWNILTISYFSNNRSFTGIQAPIALNWKPDGSKFFILNTAGVQDRVEEYTSISPWNVTDAIEGSNFNVNNIENNPQAMWWRPDGLRCYIIGTSDDTVYQLNAATPWEVSTLSDSGISYPVPQSPLTAMGLYFRKDGKKFYIADDPAGDGIVYEYDIVTPWDIANATYSGNSISVSSQTDSITEVFFSPDGDYMYFTSETGVSEIFRYVLSIPWNVSTGTFADKFDISAQETQPRGLFIREDNGKKLFMVGQAEDDIWSYDMSLEFNNSLITNFGEELITNMGDNLVYQ